MIPKKRDSPLARCRHSDGVKEEAHPSLSHVRPAARKVYSCAEEWLCATRPTWAKARGTMNWKSKLILGILTAVAMSLLTYALPRGGPLRDASLVQFPMTAGVWAIFVLLFVKLK